MNATKIKILFILLSLSLGFTGCTMSSSYIQSLFDPDIAIPPKSNIFLLIPIDSVSFEEKVLAKNLRNEMILNGFQFTESIEDAKYILTVAIDRKEIAVTYFQTIASHSSAFGNVGKLRYNAFQTDYSTIPVEGVEYYKNVIAGLFQISEGNLNQIWQIYIGATFDEYTKGAKNIPLVISALYFKNFNNQFILEYPEYSLNKFK